MMLMQLRRYGPIRPCRNSSRHDAHTYKRRTLKAGEPIEYVAVCCGRKWS